MILQLLLCGIIIGVFPLVVVVRACFRKGSSRGRHYLTTLWSLVASSFFIIVAIAKASGDITID